MFVRNVFKLRNSFKNISQIRLITTHGEINRTQTNDFNVNLNWQLAKIWVTPEHNSYQNNLSSSQLAEKEPCVVSSVGKISQINFDRIFRRIGLTISRNNNVYVQDGLYKGKKVRIVSSSKADASNASSLFEETQTHTTPDVHVLYQTEDSVLQSIKKFVLADKNKKIVLSNAKNLEEIGKVIESIDSK
jgi:hypothetical protein